MSKPTKASKITADEARSYVHYDPDTGIFTRIGFSGHGKKHLFGQRCDYLSALGYRTVMIKNTLVTAHRLAWLIMKGSWPKDQIDHINRVKDDNRFCNLREATNEQNSLNKDPTKANTNGFPGLKFDKRRNCWCARYGNKYLGQFKEKAEAIAARHEYVDKLEKEFWGEESVHTSAC